MRWIQAACGTAAGNIASEHHASGQRVHGMQSHDKFREPGGFGQTASTGVTHIQSLRHRLVCNSASWRRREHLIQSTGHINASRSATKMFAAGPDSGKPAIVLCPRRAIA